MKGTLNWQSGEVVNIHDELSLWSAPFGRLMLEELPMRPGVTILDIGFGTGFPLIELSQRFGPSSTIYGIDIWKEAILRTREKIRVLGIENIQLFEQSAEEIPLPDQSVDLICSNLGVNNFENKEKVIEECARVLKPGGHLCITTNPVGTFEELFLLFAAVAGQLNLKKTKTALKKYIEHRETKDSIKAYISRAGFKLIRYKTDQTAMRFVNAQAILDHGLIRIGFLESWEKLIPGPERTSFFDELLKRIVVQIEEKGEFKMSIPILYLEFKKTQ